MSRLFSPISGTSSFNTIKPTRNYKDMTPEAREQYRISDEISENPNKVIARQTFEMNKKLDTLIAVLKSIKTSIQNKQIPKN